LVIAGVACLALGWLLHVTGVCPSVKKIWTPSWTLFSGGWCFLVMTAVLCDGRRARLEALGLAARGHWHGNSIAMYVTAHLFHDFFAEALDTHLGKDWSLIAGEPFAPMLHGAAVLLILWLILLWMYRRKIFLRV